MLLGEGRAGTQIRWWVSEGKVTKDCGFFVFSLSFFSLFLSFLVSGLVQFSSKTIRNKQTKGKYDVHTFW